MGGDVVVEAYFTVKLGCYLILASIVLTLIIIGAVMALTDKFKK